MVVCILQLAVEPPSDRFQTRAVSSEEHVTTCEPSSEKLAVQTKLEWPTRLLITAITPRTPRLLALRMSHAHTKVLNQQFTKGACLHAASKLAL